MRLTLTTISLDVKGTFFGRTFSRGLADVSRLEGDKARVGDLVLNDTRLVDFFRLLVEQRVCNPGADAATIVKRATGTGTGVVDDDFGLCTFRVGFSFTCDDVCLCGLLMGCASSTPIVRRGAGSPGDILFFVSFLK